MFSLLLPRRPVASDFDPTSRAYVASSALLLPSLWEWVGAEVVEASRSLSPRRVLFLAAPNRGNWKAGRDVDEDEASAAAEDVASAVVVVGAAGADAIDCAAGLSPVVVVVIVVVVVVVVLLPLFVVFVVVVELDFLAPSEVDVSLLIKERPGYV